MSKEQVISAASKATGSAAKVGVNFIVRTQLEGRLGGLRAEAAGEAAGNAAGSIVEDGTKVVLNAVTDPLSKAGRAVRDFAPMVAPFAAGLVLRRLIS